WGKLYGLGFMLIAPVAVAILLIELGLGMLARGLPQMNVFVIALPVKILAGLAALTFWSHHMPAGLSRIFDLVSDVWNGAVR
ncbi:flagellar biosynthetic protein FliR, partial [Streptomyces albidoflavus]|uniref:flagellar biosynthetic protein FliR n=2 Tax=Bacteria TaxID=2 RepID=UPI00118304F0